MEALKARYSRECGMWRVGLPVALRGWRSLEWLAELVAEALGARLDECFLPRRPRGCGHRACWRLEASTSYDGRVALALMSELSVRRSSGLLYAEYVADVAEVGDDSWAPPWFTGVLKAAGAGLRQLAWRAGKCYGQGMAAVSCDFTHPRLVVLEGFPRRLVEAALKNLAPRLERSLGKEGKGLG